jgi:hypothetical protein
VNITCLDGSSSLANNATCREKSGNLTRTIKVYDYAYLKLRMSIHFEEICIKVFHPKNEGKLWSIYGYF